MVLGRPSFSSPFSRLGSSPLRGERGFFPPFFSLPLAAMKENLFFFFLFFPLRRDLHIEMEASGLHARRFFFPSLLTSLTVRARTNRKEH